MGVTKKAEKTWAEKRAAWAKKPEGWMPANKGRSAVVYRGSMPDGKVLTSTSFSVDQPTAFVGARAFDESWRTTHVMAAQEDCNDRIVEVSRVDLAAEAASEVAPVEMSVEMLCESLGVAQNLLGEIKKSSGASAIVWAHADRSARVPADASVWVEGGVFRFSGIDLRPGDPESIGMSEGGFRVRKGLVKPCGDSELDDLEDFFAIVRQLRVKPMVTEDGLKLDGVLVCPEAGEGV